MIRRGVYSDPAVASAVCARVYVDAHTSGMAFACIVRDRAVAAARLVNGQCVHTRGQPASTFATCLVVNTSASAGAGAGAGAGAAAEAEHTYSCVSVARRQRSAFWGLVILGTADDRAAEVLRTPLCRVRGANITKTRADFRSVFHALHTDHARPHTCGAEFFRPARDTAAYGREAMTYANLSGGGVRLFNDPDMERRPTPERIAAVPITRAVFLAGLSFFQSGLRWAPDHTWPAIAAALNPGTAAVAQRYGPLLQKYGLAYLVEDMHTVLREVSPVVLRVRDAYGRVRATARGGVMPIAAPEKKDALYDQVHERVHAAMLALATPHARPPAEAAMRASSCEERVLQTERLEACDMREASTIVEMRRSVHGLTYIGALAHYVGAIAQRVYQETMRDPFSAVEMVAVCDRVGERNFGALALWDLRPCELAATISVPAEFRPYLVVKHSIRRSDGVPGLILAGSACVLRYVRVACDLSASVTRAGLVGPVAHAQFLAWYRLVVPDRGGGGSVGGGGHARFPHASSAATAAAAARAPVHLAHEDPSAEAVAAAALTTIFALPSAGDAGACAHSSLLREHQNSFCQVLGVLSFCVGTKTNGTMGRCAALSCLSRLVVFLLFRLAHADGLTLRSRGRVTAADVAHNISVVHARLASQTCEAARTDAAADLVRRIPFGDFVGFEEQPGEEFAKLPVNLAEAAVKQASADAVSPGALAVMGAKNRVGNLFRGAQMWNAKATLALFGAYAFEYAGYTFRRRVRRVKCHGGGAKGVAIVRQADTALGAHLSSDDALGPLFRDLTALMPIGSGPN